MKKVFAILSSLLLTTAATPSFGTVQKINNEKMITNKMNISNSNEDSKLLTSNKTASWVEQTITGIDHEVSTRAWGKDSDNNQKWETYVKFTSKEDWNDLFNDSHYVRAYGNFSFNTYKEPRKETMLLMKLERSYTIETTRHWIFDYSHNRSTGWASQSSRIRLGLEARYDFENKITTFTLISYIYVSTAWAVHSASTSARINKIQMMQGQA